MYRYVNNFVFQALNQVAKMKQDIDNLKGGPFLHCLQKVNELETLPITVLKQIQQQMRLDLEVVEKVRVKCSSQTTISGALSVISFCTNVLLVSCPVQNSTARK